MKRSEIKSYEVMTGIMERDDPEELDPVGFEDRICYELEESVDFWGKRGESYSPEDMGGLIKSLMADFYEAYPVECALSFISPDLEKVFQVSFDINSIEIKEVNVRDVRPGEIKDEDLKKYFD